MTLGVCVIEGVLDGVGVNDKNGVKEGVGVTAPNNPYARALNEPTEPSTGDILREFGFCCEQFERSVARFNYTIGVNICSVSYTRTWYGRALPLR